jgi:hypothetical protein
MTDRNEGRTPLADILSRAVEKLRDLERIEAVERRKSPKVSNPQ